MTALLSLLGKYWKPLAITLLVAFLLWRAYDAGYESADSVWKQQWLQRDLADSTATIHREVAERAKERRRQQAADEERKRADEELAKVKLMLTLLSGLVMGCSNNSPRYAGSSQEVKPAAFPQLQQQARQKPRPQECLPSCLANLTKERESMQKRLMNAMQQDQAANEPTTK